MGRQSMPIGLAMGAPPMPIRPRRAGQWLNLVRADPALVLRYGRSAVHTRLLGPIRSRGRLGAAAMFHVGRCGSTVLSDLLAQHRSIGWDGESYVRVLTEMKRDGVIPERSGFDPVDYISGRLDRVGGRWFLYNLKFDHVSRFGWDLDRYLAGLDSIGVTRLLVVRRRNLLRKLVSGAMAEARARYHVREPGQVRPVKVRIDVDRVEMDGRLDSIVGHIERWERCYEELDRAIGERPVVRLEYEADILEDPRIAYDKVIDAMGLTAAAVDVRLERLNPFALDEVLENMDEVEAALGATRHSWMLD